jgi:hypothetical protein
LATLLATTGYWPREVEFDVKDLATVFKVLNEQRK